MGGGRLREVVAHGEVRLYSETTTNGHLSTTATLFCPRRRTVHTLTLIQTYLQRQRPLNRVPSRQNNLFNCI